MKNKISFHFALSPSVVNLIEILDKILRKLPSLTKISNPKLLARRNLKTNKRLRKTLAGLGALTFPR